MKMKPVLLLALLFLAVPLRAASDYLLELDGVKGESKDETHPDTIEIASFSWGMFNPASDGAPGRATFQDLHFTKELDAASPLLMLNCAAGKPIKKAILFVRKSGDGAARPVEYYKITLGDVLVTGISNGGSSGSGRPQEEFSLSYLTIDIEYIPTNSDGRPGEPVRFGWNVKTNEGR